MRKYLPWFFGLMIILLLNSPAICSAETRIRPYHSGSGPYQKKPVLRSGRQGKTVENYNNRGNTVGKSVQQGNTTKVHGRNRQNGWRIN